MAEVVWRPSAEDGSAVTVVVAAKARAEGDRAAGRRGGGAADEETTATVVKECGGCRLSLSTTIAAPTKAGEIPARTMMEEEVAVEAAVVARRIATPPPPPGGRLQFYRIALALAVECSTLYTAAPSASAAAAARQWRRTSFR